MLCVGRLEDYPISLDLHICDLVSPSLVSSSIHLLVLPLLSVCRGCDAERCFILTSSTQVPTVPTLNYVPVSVSAEQRN